MREFIALSDEGTEKKLSYIPKSNCLLQIPSYVLELNLGFEYRFWGFALG